MDILLEMPIALYIGKEEEAVGTRVIVRALIDFRHYRISYENPTTHGTTLVMRDGGEIEIAMEFESFLEILKKAMSAISGGHAVQIMYDDSNEPQSH